jgi:hypothetical protein
MAVFSSADAPGRKDRARWGRIVAAPAVEVDAQKVAGDRDYIKVARLDKLKRGAQRAA